MIQAPELKPVRDYSNIRKDALAPFLREAAGANEGLDQRARDFREHAVRVLGPEEFQKSRDQLLDGLKNEARSWGLSFHANPDKVIDFVAENPIALKLPLGKLLQVAANHSTVTGFLADAIDSLVVHIVLNSTPKDIEQALQRAASVGGLDSAPFHPINPIEFAEIPKWPFEGLNRITFHYLDKVLEDWGKNTATLDQLTPDELHSFMIRNAPRSESLDPKERLELLKGATRLALSKVAPLLRKMNTGRNNVGDVLSAALDTAVHENGLQWMESVGRGIDWQDRFRGELHFEEPSSGDSGTSEDTNQTKAPPSNQSVPDESTTKVGKKPRRNQPTKVL